MADITRPDYGVVWANAGERIAPEPVKMNLGWVQEMMPFQYENWLQARQDEAITYILQKGIAEYSTTQDYIANKSLALYQGAVYLATQNNTNVLPTVQANWKRISTISNNDGVVSVGGGGTGATTPEQARLNLGLGSAAVLDAAVVVQKDAQGNFTAGTITASLNGTATSAQKLATARSITLTGAVTSTAAMFDGSANVTVITTSVNAANLTGQVPVASLSAAVTKTSATGSAELPSGTTAERDVVTKEGYLRYNKTSKLLEYWNGAAWIVPNGTDLGSLVGTGPGQISNNTMLDARTVAKTSPTGSAKMPSGPTASRDDPAEGGFTRFNSETKKLEVYDGEKWTNIGSDSGSLFEYIWHNGPRSSIAGGFIPCDGQQLTQLMYPEAFDQVRAGKQYSIDEATWQVASLDRSKWSMGTAGWVRVPDLNGVQTGSGSKAFYLRGSPSSLGGQGVGDAMRRINFSFYGANGSGFQSLSGQISGLTPQSWRNAVEQSSGTYFGGISVDTALSQPTADEFRPKSAHGVWCVRVATEVVNEGSVDVLQLATQVNVLESEVGNLGDRVDILDGQSGSVYIYFGGTEASPVNLSLNSQLTQANPFPGKRVALRLEFKNGSEWIEPGFYTNNTGAYGAAARHKYSTDTIYAISSLTGVMPRASIGCNLSGNGSDATGPLPVRVLVWKV